VSNKNGKSVQNDMVSLRSHKRSSSLLIHTEALTVYLLFGSRELFS